MVFVGILRLLLGTVVDTKIDPPGFGGGEQHPRRSGSKKMTDLLMFYLGMDQNLIHTIFRGMNIHLPAILGFTRYQGFDPSPLMFYFCA